MDILYYIGIGINFFLLLILLTKKRKSFADYILAAWLLLIGVHTILYVVSLSSASEANIHWIIGLSAPFTLVHAPFLYIYVAANTGAISVKRVTWLLHFVPFIASILLLMPLYLMSAKDKMALYNSGGAEYANINAILSLFINLSGIVYILLSFILLRKHKENIGNQFSYERKINLNWLRYLIYGLLVIWLIIMLLKKSSLIFGAGVFFVTFLGFLGIRQVGIFGLDYAANSNEEGSSINPIIPESPILNDSEENQPKKKYANSGLSDEQADLLHEALMQLMETEKYYTEPELSLNMLASKLDVHPNYLSQIINEREGISFFDFINSMRVQEFKRLVIEKDLRQYTLISLAFECGFNSKSSFYKNFKKLTGQSPSDYVNAL